MRNNLTVDFARAPKCICERDELLWFMGYLLEISGANADTSVEIPSTTFPEGTFYKGLVWIRRKADILQGSYHVIGNRSGDNDIVPIDPEIPSGNQIRRKRLNGAIEDQSLELKREAVPHRGKLLKPYPTPVHKSEWRAKGREMSEPRWGQHPLHQRRCHSVAGRGQVNSRKVTR
jgi:hypothetical protein